MILIIGFTCPPTMHFKFITKCNKCSYKVRQLILLQRAMVCYFKVRQLFLQSATSVFTTCDRYYKVRQFYFNVRQVLQSATEQPILGDPGVGSQDDRMFVVKDYSKIEHSIVPTSCPWVSEDGLGFTVTITNERCNCQ